MVTADLPAFSKPGQRIDITVSAIGKAKSLRGGALIWPRSMAPMADLCHGAGQSGRGRAGVAAQDGSQVSVNIPTVGRIAEGASVERAVDTGFERAPVLRYNLNNADFLTAQRVRDAINLRYPGMASAEDAVTVALRLPDGADTRAFDDGRDRDDRHHPAEAAAKVIVNSRTGTVVINSAVRLSPAAVSHGKLTVRIDEKARVTQPAPFPMAAPPSRPAATSPPKKKRPISPC
jgi:flagellar P-ring protein precursor FlgI